MCSAERKCGSCRKRSIHTSEIIESVEELVLSQKRCTQPELIDSALLWAQSNDIFWMWLSHIGNFWFLIPVFNYLYLRNYAANFVEICNIYRSQDLYFGVTFLGCSVDNSAGILSTAAGIVHIICSHTHTESVYISSMLMMISGCVCYSYQPAPFFVLDEIDAALDNTNIGKVWYLSLFSYYSAIRVYVIISFCCFWHGRYSIKIACLLLYELLRNFLCWGKFQVV